MNRIPPIDPARATGEAKQLLDSVRSSLGMVPNFIRVLANSPAALNAFLGIHGIAGAGLLDARTRERIALVSPNRTPASTAFRRIPRSAARPASTIRKCWRTARAVRRMPRRKPH